MDGYQLVTIVQ